MEFYAIKIEDNGIGFQKEHGRTIFELFKRLHSKEQYSGTGVGLTICKTIIQNHNGWIEVSSTLNFSSIFILYLPKV